LGRTHEYAAREVVTLVRLPRLDIPLGWGRDVSGRQEPKINARTYSDARSGGFGFNALACLFELLPCRLERYSRQQIASTRKTAQGVSC
jgi:hypothetical protein